MSADFQDGICACWITCRRLLSAGGKSGILQAPFLKEPMLVTMAVTGMRPPLIYPPFRNKSVAI
jgi:hypothetical protein